MSLNDIEKNLSKLSKITPEVIRTLEVSAVKSVMTNFETGGRGVPGLTPWKKSQKRGKAKGTKTLVISGAMSQIQSEARYESTGVEIILSPGPNASAYSRIQHEGGTINMPARQLRFRKNKNQRTVFAGAKHKRITKETMAKPYQINIPARPYLVIPEEDFSNIIDALASAMRF